jgi:hypothetical protein
MRKYSGFTMENTLMKMLITLVTTTSLIGLLSAGFVTAQPGMMGRGVMGRGSGGWGMGSSYQQFYNPKTVETITGEVVAIDSIMPMGGMSGGVHLRVRTPKNAMISVHLGPSWYLDRQDVSLQVKDKIQIKGSQVKIAGKPALIAAEIQKGSQTLILRDTNGLPMWSGWRR